MFFSNKSYVSNSFRMLRRMNSWANVKTENLCFLVLRNNYLKPNGIFGKWLSEVMKHKAQLKNPDSVSSLHILWHPPCAERHIRMLEAAKVWGFWKVVLFSFPVHLFQFFFGIRGIIWVGQSTLGAISDVHVQLVHCKLHPCELSPFMQELTWSLSKVFEHLQQFSLKTTGWQPWGRYGRVAFLFTPW